MVVDDKDLVSGQMHIGADQSWKFRAWSHGGQVPLVSLSWYAKQPFRHKQAMSDLEHLPCGMPSAMCVPGLT